MHKIVSGVANRSYGIQVAKMAGMPASVVSRAECVLAALENNEMSVPVQQTKSQPRKKNTVCNDTPPQLNLFG